MTPDTALGLLRRVRLRSFKLASAAVFAALLCVQLLFWHAQMDEPTERSAAVCIASADPMLVPASRGTAEALWNLAHELDSQGVSVHIILLSDNHETCLHSIENMMLASRSVLASCAYTGGAPGSFLYRPRSSLLKHMSQRALGCSVLISHEWWTPLQDLLTERYFALGDDAKLPSAVVMNVHGGAQWSNSWSNSSVLRYIDVVEDADERAGAFLADAVVFPTPYMSDYHTARWALPVARHVIPNIVLNLGKRAHFGNRAQRFACLAFVGSVEQRKGIDALLMVLASLIEFPSIELHIFGVMGMVDSVPSGEYISTALRAAPHVNCTVHGAVSAKHLWTLLKRLNALVVMPTLLENQPMTVINAYQYRIPVVCFDVGGVSSMLTPASRMAVLIPPTRAHLQERLAMLLHTQRASVPKLSDAMFGASRTWLGFVHHQLGVTRPSAHRLARLRSAASFMSITVTDLTTTHELHVRLLNLSTSFVLLMRAQYLLLPEKEDSLHALAEHLDRQGSSGIAGVVGLVRLRHTSLFPQAPFFLPSHNWLSCGPEVPLLARRSLLLSYTLLFPGVPFRQWLFTAWLMYKPVDPLVVLRIPTIFFLHSRFVDPLLCFHTNQASAQPPDNMLADLGAFSHMVVPTSAVQANIDNLDSRFRSIILDACKHYARTTHDTLWLRAVADPAPRLCSASVEHGLFSLRALKTSLLNSCGAYCVYPVGDMPGPPALSFAWGLDTQAMCWQEVSSMHPCSEWYGQRARTFPGALPWPASFPKPAVFHGTSCGFVLAPLQHPPVGFCGPRLVYAHFSSCMPDSSSHNGLLHLVSAASSHAAEVQYATFWTQQDLPMVESDGLLIDLSKLDAPSRLSAVLQNARVIFVVCEPAQRMRREFDKWKSEDAGDALYALNLTTFEQAVQVLSPASSVCTFSTSMPYEQLLNCQQLQRRLLFPGFYAQHLHDWLTEFARDDILIIDKDANLSSNEQRVQQFLNVKAPPKLPLTSWRTPAAIADPTTAEQLHALFDAHNSWFARLTGETFPWLAKTKENQED
jgi:glycosyltransferase involved in cell wall biosynthesis